MNKAQLVEKIALKMKLSKSQTEQYLDATIAIIEDSVAKGDEVKIVGFGTFCKVKRSSRKGRNPKTGEPVEIPGGAVPRFRPGKDFKDRMI
jgi:DNA-binding protein HU-beta